MCPKIGKVLGRVVSGIATGGLSEASRAAKVPIELGSAALNKSQGKQILADPGAEGPTTPAPTPEPIPPQDAVDPDKALSNELRRRRRGAAGARPNLGKTLVTGSQGVSDDVFGSGGKKTLLGGG